MSDPKESNNRLRNQLIQRYCISCTQVEQPASSQENVQPVSVSTRTGQLLRDTQRAAPGPTQLHPRPVRQGINRHLSLHQKPLLGNHCVVLWYFLCVSLVCVESLRSDRMDLKGPCVCGIRRTNPCHPCAAAHEQHFQCYETMLLCHCPSCGDSSYTSLPVPGQFTQYTPLGLLGW